MIRTILELIDASYPLKEVEVGEAGAFSAAGMKFSTTHYDADKLGSVSVMKAKGFFGIMQMSTVIINPLNIDAPLVSFDSIKVFGNTKVYMEMFDTTLNHAFDIEKMESIAESEKSIPEEEFAPHWYDYLRLGTPQCRKVKEKQIPAFNKWAEEYFRAYLESCRNAKTCDESEKRKMAAVYSDGLLANAGKPFLPEGMYLDIVPISDNSWKKVADNKPFYRKKLFG